MYQGVMQLLPEVTVRWSKVHKVLAPNLNLDDYEVCKRLSPSIVFLVNMVESQDFRVDRIEVSVENSRIRVYPLSEDAKEALSFVESALPPSMVEDLLQYSSGDPTPWPEPPIPKDASDLLERLNQVLLDHSPIDKDLGIVLHAHDFGEVRKYWGKRLKLIDQRDLLKRGYFADLGPENVPIFCSRHVPLGFVGLGYNLGLPPDLYQVTFYRISTRTPCNPPIPSARFRSLSCALDSSQSS